ncbi:unnamed protein product [Sphagnum jensenii]|uniref:Molybdate-anion transporter n=1 Tax=Sphagnum jensenii TaxID=128206 RepID=A0ABP0VDU1_9BRYO
MVSTLFGGHYEMLLLGRVVFGVGSALHHAAFDAYLLHEHTARGFPDDWLSQTFAQLSHSVSLVAVLSGVAGQTAMSAAPLGPALLSALLFGLAGACVSVFWGQDHTGERTLYAPAGAAGPEPGVTGSARQQADGAAHGNYCSLRGGRDRIHLLLGAVAAGTRLCGERGDPALRAYLLCTRHFGHARQLRLSAEHLNGWRVCGRGASSRECWCPLLEPSSWARSFRRPQWPCWFLTLSACASLFAAAAYLQTQLSGSDSRVPLRKGADEDDVEFADSDTEGL